MATSRHEGSLRTGVVLFVLLWLVGLTLTHVWVKKPKFVMLEKGGMFWVAKAVCAREIQLSSGMQLPGAPSMSKAAGAPSPLVKCCSVSV